MITSLPPEILFRVLQFTTLYDAARLSQTNHELAQFMSHNQAWLSVPQTSLFAPQIKGQQSVKSQLYKTLMNLSTLKEAIMLDTEARTVKLSLAKIQTLLLFSIHWIVMTSVFGCFFDFLLMPILPKSHDLFICLAVLFSSQMILSLITHKWYQATRATLFGTISESLYAAIHQHVRPVFLLNLSASLCLFGLQSLVTTLLGSLCMMASVASSSIKYFAKPSLHSSLVFASTSMLVFSVAYESNILSLSQWYTRTCLVILLVSLWILVIAIGVVWMQKFVDTRYLSLAIDSMIMSRWSQTLFSIIIFLALSAFIPIASIVYDWNFSVIRLVLGTLAAISLTSTRFLLATRRSKALSILFIVLLSILLMNVFSCSTLLTTISTVFFQSTNLDQAWQLAAQNILIQMSNLYVYLVFTLVKTFYNVWNQSTRQDTFQLQVNQRWLDGIKLE